MTIKVKLQAVAAPQTLTVVEDNVDRLEQMKEKIWDSKKDEIVLKGFRKGQVPRSLAERQFGMTTLYEGMLNQILSEGVASMTDGKVVSVENVNVDLFQEKKALVMHATVYLAPVVHLAEQYKKLEVEIDSVAVSDEEVAAVVQRMREGAAVVRTVEGEAQLGHVVVVDVEGRLPDGTKFEGGKVDDASLVLGEGRFLPQLEQGVVGMKVGETRDVAVSFPTDYHATELAGKDSVFSVVVKSIQEREVPEINDEFIQKLGYGSLVECQDKLRTDLMTNKQQQRQQQFESRALSNLISVVKIDPIPECMFTAELETLVGNILQQNKISKEENAKEAKLAEEQLRSRFRPTAMQNVRARLILSKVAEIEGLKVTEEERVNLLKTLYPGKSVERLSEEINMAIVDMNVLLQKAFDVVKSNAVLKEHVAGQPPVALKE